MDIKQKIAERIRAIRKERGLTVKELAEKTVNLKPQRITNWEQGTRSPGPMEAKQLAQALHVPAAYLLCLTNDEDLYISQRGGIVAPALPVLTLGALAQYDSVDAAIEDHTFDDHLCVPIRKSLAEKVGATAFTTILTDESMAPEFRTRDRIVIDPHTKPKPSQYVLAKPSNKTTPILRKYREAGIDKNGQKRYELVAHHADWASIILDASSSTVILGTLVAMERVY